MKTTIIKLNPKHPDPNQIREIASQLANGKLVAFPTETVYGIAVSASHPDAVERLYALKGRPEQKLFTYHIGRLGTLERLELSKNPVFEYFVDLFFPGPVTLIASNDQGRKIGIRFPKNPLAAELVDRTGVLVLATSANRSGQASPVSVDDVLDAFSGELDVIIDGGKTEFGIDSTVVDTTVMPPAVLRPGAMLAEVERAIHQVTQNRFTRKRILIVCTGNTCRSPMAECWLTAELKKQKYSEQIKVRSCGIYARDGGGMSVESELALKNDGVEPGDFRASLCRREDVLRSDIILAMSGEHRKFISELCPEAADRIISLDISDPIGLSLDHYEKCYTAIKEKISKHWKEIVK